MSIDSIYAHITWVNPVQEKSCVLFGFPNIADLDMHVANLYGMLQPGKAKRQQCDADDLQKWKTNVETKRCGACPSIN